MKAPLLNTRIRIYQTSETKDATGAARATTSRTLWKKVFASVRHLSGARGERPQAGQTTHRLQAVFTVRAKQCCCDTVRPDMMIQHDGYWWEIDYVSPLNGNDRYEEITATRGGYHNEPGATRPIL